MVCHDKKKHILRVFESGVLIGIFGSQKNKVTGGWRGLHGSWNPSLTNSGIQDNFPVTQYVIPSDFCCVPIYSKSIHIAEASVVDKILSFTWIIPTSLTLKYGSTVHHS